MGGARGQKGSSIPRPKSSIPSNRVAPKKKLTSQVSSSSSLSKTSIPKQQLPRPQSSAASSINATSSTKNKTFDSARWSRLATPKSVVPKAKTETRKTVVTKSVVPTKKKETLVKPKVTKKVQAPKTPETVKTTRPIIESQLGQKSCPREMKEKKRRRTRFSVNTEELKQNLDEWRQTDVGKMDQKQLWNSLSQEDSKSKTATEVLIVSLKLNINQIIKT